MNPLAPPTKFASRVFMALAAIAGIFLTVGCGSNSNGTPNQNGFTNSNFSGTYVIAVSGTDINSQTESFFTIVGTIIADGNGNITGGTVDINDPNIGGVFPGQSLSKSTYSVNADGRATAQMITPQGTFGLDFVISSSSHGLVTRFDLNGTGSGTLDIQGSAPEGSLGALAFSLSGADVNQNPLGTVGSVVLNSSGEITTGVQDINDNTDSAGFTGLPLSGSLVLSSTTNGTAEFDSDFGSLLFDVWVIDSTHVKLIETDTSGLALSGDAFTQVTNFTAGQLVYTASGIDSNGSPIAVGGYVTTDVNGTLSAGLEDYNNAGVANTVSPFIANCNGVLAPFPGGRCQLITTAFTNGLQVNLQFAAYPFSGGVFLLENDSAGFLQGTAYNQTATAFNPPAGYALNLSGVNSDGVNEAEVDDIAQFNATTTAAPAVNATGVLDENSLLNGTPVQSLALSGTYAPDSPATGRGSFNVPSIRTAIGTLNLEYYVVNSSTVLFIEVDQAQLSSGIFDLQATPGNQGGQAMAQAAAQSHVSTIRPITRLRANKATNWGKK